MINTYACTQFDLKRQFGTLQVAFYRKYPVLPPEKRQFIGRVSGRRSRNRSPRLFFFFSQYLRCSESRASRPRRGPAERAAQRSIWPCPPPHSASAVHLRPPSRRWGGSGARRRASSRESLLLPVGAVTAAGQSRRRRFMAADEMKCYR